MIQEGQNRVSLEHRLRHITAASAYSKAALDKWEQASEIRPHCDAPPHPAHFWWRERQNRGVYNTSTDKRQTKGGGLESECTENERERLIKNTCCWGVQRGPEQNPIITCLFLSISASILHYKWSIHRDSHSNRAESPDLQHTCSVPDPGSVPKIRPCERTGKLTKDTHSPRSWLPFCSEHFGIFFEIAS